MATASKTSPKRRVEKPYACPANTDPNHTINRAYITATAHADASGSHLSRSEGQDHPHRGAAAAMKVTSEQSARQQAVDEVTDWLQSVWRLMAQGRINTFRPVPVYERRKLLPDSKINEIAAAIEDVFAYELDNYPGWHSDAQQIRPNQTLVTPGFSDLPPFQKRALVEGVDRILQKYRVEPKPRRRNLPKRVG